MQVKKITTGRCRVWPIYFGAVRKFVGWVYSPTACHRGERWGEYTHPTNSVCSRRACSRYLRGQENDVRCASGTYTASKLGGYTGYFAGRA